MNKHWFETPARLAMVRVTHYLAALLNAVLLGTPASALPFREWWSEAKSVVTPKGVMFILGVSRFSLETDKSLDVTVESRFPNLFAAHLSSWIDSVKNPTARDRGQLVSRPFPSPTAENIYREVDNPVFKTVTALARSINAASTGHKPSAGFGDNLEQAVTQCLGTSTGALVMLSVLGTDPKTGLLIPSRDLKVENLAVMWSNPNGSASESAYFSGRKLPVGKTTQHRRFPTEYLVYREGAETSGFWGRLQNVARL